jgi:ribosomal protein S18 acetylase RimI-like enzyme
LTLLTTPCRIYPATLSDLEQLTEVLAHSFYAPAGIQGLFFPMQKFGIQQELRQRLRARQQGYCCLAAWTGPHLVGTLEISLRKFRAVPGQNRQPYISNLAVLPHWRKQEIAAELMRGAEGIVQVWGYHRLHLHVLENNSVARRLYQKLYYQVLSTPPDPLEWLGCPRQLLLYKVLP